MNTEAPMALRDLASQRLWVAWQTELRKPDDEKPTKVPYSPHGAQGRKAKANDWTTWGTREAAEARAAGLAKPFGLGGVGIELSALANGQSLGGIDLDDCRNPETGDLQDWASAVIKQFATYTEVSPSGTGVKVFFLYETAGELTLRSALGYSANKQPKYSAVWKRPSDNLKIARCGAVIKRHGGTYLGAAAMRTTKTPKLRTSRRREVSNAEQRPGDGTLWGWHALPVAIQLGIEADIELAHGHIARAEHLAQRAAAIREAAP